MNAHAILTEFDRRGITLRVEGDNLIAKPLSAVTPELREAARQHKAELLARLRLDENRAAETRGITHANSHPPIAPESAQPNNDDDARRERDRLARRGCDFDASSPSAVALRQDQLEMARVNGRWLPNCPKCNGTRFWLTTAGNIICGACSAAHWRVKILQIAPLN